MAPLLPCRFSAVSAAFVKFQNQLVSSPADVLIRIVLNSNINLGSNDILTILSSNPPTHHIPLSVSSVLQFSMSVSYISFVKSVPKYTWLFSTAVSSLQLKSTTLHCRGLRRPLWRRDRAADRAVLTHRGLFLMSLWQCVHVHPNLPVSSPICPLWKA